MTWSLTPICERKFCAGLVRPRWMIHAPAFPMTRSRRGGSVSLRCRARSPPYGERAGDEALEIYTRRIVLVQRPSVALHGYRITHDHRHEDMRGGCSLEPDPEDTVAANIRNPWPE